MTDERPGAVEWVTLALIGGSAILSAVLELLFLSRWYAGTVLVPVVILAAIGGNVALPYWGYTVLGRVMGAVLPVGLWLIVIVLLTLYTRPEGDILVAGNHGQNLGFYGLFFGGAIAGFVTIARLTTRR
ncbi:MAG TPA: DUF6113 family protein [Jatrophihabitans sp.]